jgi:formate dehydrogenase maturation protein FdhE
MTESVWAAYRRRAEKLNDGAANPLLAKYIELVSIQDELSSLLIETCEVPIVTSDLALLSYFDDVALRALLVKAMRGVAKGGPPVHEAESLESLENLWHQVDEFEYPADLPARLVLEVFATEVSAWPHREIETRPDRCPHCGFPVMCSMLREAGLGRSRYGCCSLCGSEWPEPRLGCLRCGEQHSAKLPLFTFEELPHIRIEACDSCGGWLKSIDLTRDAEALPMPDDVWSSVANIWAFEQGYQNIGNNLFRL